MQVVLNDSHWRWYEAQGHPQHSRFLIEATDILQDTGRAAGEKRRAAAAGARCQAAGDVIEIRTPRRVIARRVRGMSRRAVATRIARVALALVVTAGAARAQPSTIILV